MVSKPRLSPARKGEIATFAEFIADEYFPEGLIEPQELIPQKGLTVSFGAYGDSFDGMLECLGGKFHVFCNLDRVGGRTSPRARFTLAHELGHFFLDGHRLALMRGVPPHGSRCEYESSLLTEQEADTFAANLLLPQGRFLRAARGAHLGLSGILTLAERFRTSVTATAIRCAQEDLFPCVVIKWHKDGYGWKWISPTMYRNGYRKTRQDVNQIPADSATGQALAGSQPGGGVFHRCGSTASHWFPFITLGGGRDSILWEEAITLGRYGVLTVLYADGP